MIRIGDSTAVVFKIPSTPARRRTLRDFEARPPRCWLTRAISRYSRGARATRRYCLKTQPPPPLTPFSLLRLHPIAVASWRPTSLFLRAPVCTYVIEYVSRWCRPVLLPPPPPLPSLFTPELVLSFPLSHSLIPLFRVYSLSNADGNPDRIQVICGDILPRSKSGVTSRFSPSSPPSSFRAFILDWIFGEESVQPCFHIYT